MWICGFTGLILGAGLGAIISAPKWALWGGLVGLCFWSLLVLVISVVRWFVGNAIIHEVSWESQIFMFIFISLDFAVIAAAVRMGLAGLVRRSMGEEHQGDGT
jgi:hypothetical protein